MTAPLRSGEPITVNVALGDRAYDIAIGRGLLTSLGERIARLRPGCKAAIVTDETVARHHLAATESSACGRRPRRVARQGAGRRKQQELPHA
jgi:3-dehydroquinate synthetase